VKPAFLLLLGSFQLPTSLLLLAFVLLLGCHRLVSDCMAHSRQFSTDIHLVKLLHFFKVVVTIAIWQRCSKIVMILNSMLTTSHRMTYLQTNVNHSYLFVTLIYFL
jgi:hypothetical protein